MEGAKCITALPAANKIALTEVLKISSCFVYRSWGMNNRETPIRFIPHTDSRQTNFEVRSVLHTSVLLCSVDDLFRGNK